MRKRMVMANWKMNGSQASINRLLDHLLQELTPQLAAHCVVFPPAVYLPLVQARLTDHALQWGAQNVYVKVAGAYTGELACSMLTEFGCRYVLVGHSERRQLFHEDLKCVAEKFHWAKEHGMIPVLCIGETLQERDAGKMHAVLDSQLSAISRHSVTDFKQCVIAYEPVWAIGTGQTATPHEAQEAHAFIRRWVGARDSNSALGLPILYGGSVSASNAHALFGMPDIDGGLVGSASLDAGQFSEIVKCIK